MCCCVLFFYLRLAVFVCLFVCLFVFILKLCLIGVEKCVLYPILTPKKRKKPQISAVFDLKTCFLKVFCCYFVGVVVFLSGFL